MVKHYRLELFTWLSILLLVGLINFIFALTTGINFIDLGLPNVYENVIVAIFSFALIIFLVWEMWNL